MITGITIENFKGIRERVKLDFRPITLLFGANSAGKSTVLQMLLYVRRVFERHNLDADHVIQGGADRSGFFEECLSSGMLWFCPAGQPCQSPEHTEIECKCDSLSHSRPCSHSVPRIGPKVLLANGDEIQRFL